MMAVVERRGARRRPRPVSKVTTSEDGQQMSFDIDCEDEAANEVFDQV